ncbi:hypothetical protein DL768_008415 [Monosporascus sp. mg162]|nr:hypothetical protein DL768_008415 [Monosporascus sp. mg162]
MRVSVSAPSLPEARNVNRDHNHQHSRSDSHSHNHNRFHNRNHNDSTNSNHPHIHSQHHHYNGKRNPQQIDNSDIIVIVETVSIVEVIDATGSIIEIQTLPPDVHTTGLATPPAETTVDVDTSVELPGNLTSTPSVSLPSIVPTGDSGYDTALSSPAYNSTIDPAVTTSAQSESLMSPFPTLSYSPITSAPLSEGSGFPTFPGVTNSSQALSTSLLNHNSVSVLSFTSSGSGSPSSSSPFTTLSTSTSNLPSLFQSSSVGTTSSTVTQSAPSSTSSVPATSSTSSAPTTSSTSSAPTTSSTSSAPTTSSTSSAPATSASDATFIGGGGGEESSPPTPPSGESDSGSSDGPPTGTVVGSVIGGIAGLAFIVFLALAFIKWRKRQANLKLMGGSGGERGVSNQSPGDSGPGGSGGMSEQPRSAPFAVPAALANLTSPKGPSPAPEGEKGFQKISGRKLPSVITSGGDGYTDPRATFMSDDSQDSYRDSHAFFSGLNKPRFAVGSPMRPESGIPVFHPGPSKTPVTEQGPFNPFTDNSYPVDSPRKDTHLEPPQRDALGRSHPSQDGSTRSHGSGSRFTENI